jgi:LPPG:FO 2-phospho-L-lactate transferase
MKIAALAGGVGGAKLAHGLALCLPPEDLTIVVNTGDDFEHLGLYICPDLDTVCYTLAGLANPETGWGRAGETWQAMNGVEHLGGPGWFRLGDQDLGTHLERTRRLKAGQKLSQVTRDFCRAWGIKPIVLPMSDERVATIVDTVEEGELSFQEYFVLHRCQPQVKDFRFAGIESASPAPGVLEALAEAEAVVLCPSNPWVSIDPILAVAGLRSTMNRKPIAAVSPIIDGQTVKGPAAKMFREMGIAPSPLSVAAHYHGLLTGLVLDNADTGYTQSLCDRELQTCMTDTLMRNPEDRRRLAEDVLNFIEKLVTP